MRRLTGLFYATQFILLPAVALLALFVPIYTDEVVWKIVQARYFIDGHSAIYVFPQCGSSFSVAPPGWSTPILALQAWLYADLSHLFKLRLIGTLSYLGWIAVLWRASLRLPNLQGVVSRRTLALILSYLGLGVLPLAMVINRPEQPLLWGLTILIFFPFVMNRDAGNKIGSSDPARGFFYCLLWAVLLVIHPKTVFFLPLLLVSLFLSVRSWKVRAPASLAVAVLTFQTCRFWGRRLSCPEIPALQTLLDSHMLRPAEALSSPLGFLARGLNNIKNISIHFDNLGFSERYNQNWLPPTPSSGLDQALLSVGMELLLILGLLLALRWIYLVISERNRERGAILAALSASILAWSFFQGVKNFYEIALFFPLCGVLLLLGFDRKDYERYRRLYQVVATMLLVISLACQVDLIRLFAPEAAGPWSRGGYLTAQPVSISPFHEQEQARRITQTARMCGIGDTGLKHLVIDDLTYSVYWNTYQPYHILFLGEPWADSTHLPEFLHESGSSGVIVGCGSLPSSLRARAVHNGDFCCLPYSPSSSSPS